MAESDESKQQPRFDGRDAVFALGLILLAAGLAMVWLPAALIVPGAVLVYATLRV